MNLYRRDVAGRLRSIHIVPIEDLREHVTMGLACACEPAEERVNGVRLVTHQGFDGRELVERHGLQ